MTLKKVKVIKKADPTTFVLLNDGFYAKDAERIFCGGLPLNKANVKAWAKLSTNEESCYSKDDKRIYYLNREMKNADYHTFEVIIPPAYKDGNYLAQYAKDKNHYYFCELIISEEEYQKRECNE